MSNETISGLKRVSWLPDRDATENGTLLAGQEYYDVYITGGEISGVTISGVTINADELDGTTLASNVVNSSLTSVGTLTNLTVTNPITGSVTGNAGTVTVADAASDTTTFPLLAGSATGNLPPLTDAGLLYNASTNALTTTTFIGALTGNASTATSATTATTLATPRAIYGNNFDGSAALTQVIASTFGGTGNGFSKFSGATTTEKTYTLPDASAAILTDNATVTVAQGGTGRATGTTAYALVATGTTATGAQQSLAAGATTEILVGGGASALPVWTTAQGSGAPVRATSPTLTTPNIGVATATSIALGGGTALANYLEGTFTPTVTCTTVGDLSVSYATQTGTYTRIGNRCLFDLVLTFTPTYTTATGNIRLDSLPFTVGAQAAVTLAEISQINLPASRTQFTARAVSGQTYIQMQGVGDTVNATNLTITDFATGVAVTLYVSGSFRI